MILARQHSASFSVGGFVGDGSTVPFLLSPRHERQVRALFVVQGTIGYLVFGCAANDKFVRLFVW